MPAAAAPLAAEALLVEAAVAGGAGTALGTGLVAGGGLGLLGASGGLGLTAAGTGLGLGSGIAGLSSVPIAAATAATPLAMGQIGAALAPAYGLGGAATGLGTGLTAGGGLGLTTSGGLGLGSGLGLSGATAGTALGTGAELYGLGTTTISPEIAALQQQLANTAMPQVTELGQVATSNLTPEMLQQPLTQNQTIQQAIADTAKNTGLTSTLPNAGIHGTLTPGTSHLVGGGIQPTFTESLGGIKDLIGSGIQSGIDLIKENPKTAAGAVAAYKLLNDSKTSTPEREKYSGPLSRYAYDPDKYTPYTPQPPANPYKAQYTSYARGGIANLGGYSDGGRMLKGPGDGMSDSIPASIAGKQPARLANEEFVVPADVVSHLGNGSSDAGAKQLYRMMDRIRKARTGTKKQGRQINPNKYMPA